MLEAARSTSIIMIEQVQPSLVLTPTRVNERSYPQLPGDMAEEGIDAHKKHVAILNTVFSSVEVRDSEAIAATVKYLDDHLSSYREHVQSKYPEEISSAIAERYKAADESTEGMSMEERVRTRLQTAEQLSIISDFDGTISKEPNHYLLTHIPGSAIAEPRLEQHGRGHFTRVFAEVWSEYLKDEFAQRVYFNGGQLVELRSGVNELFGKVKELGADMTVLSANFEPFVEGGLSQIPNADGTQLIAVRENDLRSTAKDLVIKDLSQAKPSYATIFIGDGSSDLPAMEASEVVACYFALEGSSFAKELEARKLAHFTYGDFNDIRVKLGEIYKPLEFRSQEIYSAEAA